MTIQQHAVRILLINQNSEILLFRGIPTTNIVNMKGQTLGDHWFTPGGRIDEGEDESTAAIRELYEETGMTEDDVEIGPFVWRGEIDLILYGEHTNVKQTYMVMHTKKDNISTENFTEEEKRCIAEYRWFSLSAIEACEDAIFPECILDHLPSILEGKYPDKPLEIIL